jgi:hypothetical protein
VSRWQEAVQLLLLPAGTVAALAMLPLLLLPLLL